MAERSKARPERVSLRAFAALVGVTHPAVRKGIRSGRLRESVRRDARGPFVHDVALARREWRAGASKPANGGGRKPAAGVEAPAVAGNGKAHDAGTLVAAQVRLTDERATALELANKRKRGELLDAATVAREHFELARTVRERILNIPDRMPELDAALRTRIREELRTALGALADELARDE